MGKGVLGAVVVASWLAVTGGGSFAGAAQQGGDTCSSSGTALSITAFDNKFDKGCLAAPAHQAFTIDFTNLDRGIPHNVAIYEDETAQTMYFRGERVEGPGKTVYSVEGLSVGKFFFRCDPHPEMNGRFVSG